MSDTEDRPQYRINEGRYFRAQLDRALAGTEGWTPQFAEQFSYITGVVQGLRYYAGNGSCIPHMQHNVVNGQSSSPLAEHAALGPATIRTIEPPIIGPNWSSFGFEAFVAPLRDALHLVQLSDLDSSFVGLMPLSHHLRIGGAFLDLLAELPDDI